MVVAQAKNAREAGVAVLDAGGNAIDAALATALALAAVEPWNSGLGGIGHAVVHRAGEARAETVDFGPTAPAALDPERFKLTGKVAADLFGWPEVEGDVNIHGPLSFVIPSAVAGYEEMHRRWGSCRSPRSPRPRSRSPARPAEDWYTTLKIASRRRSCGTIPRARASICATAAAVPPYQGGLKYFRLGRLPDTLERLAKAGWRDFYEGEIAASIVADVKQMGGVLSAEDSAQLQGARLAATEVLARPHAATLRPAHRGADRRRRAAPHRRRALRRRRRTPPGTSRSRAR
jgi:gamma-glutamyltranspeptidase/glutathione hydrolase